MKPTWTAAAVAAGIGFAIAGFAIAHAADSTNTTDVRRDIKAIASEVASSLFRGIILGANVGPYPSGLIPANIESRVTASGYTPAQITDSNSDE
jgi:hypothetical protein